MVRTKRERYHKAYLVLWMASFLLIGIVLGTPGNAFAGEAKNGMAIVLDEASLLEDAEAEAVAKNAQELAKQTGWNIIIATCEDANGKSAQTVGEEYFIQYADGKDGVVCLIDMDNREIFLVTSGEAISYLTDKRIDNILDDAYESISDKEYKECMTEMLDGTGRYYKKGVPDNQKIYNEDTGETIINRKLTGMEILVTLLVGLAAGGGVAGGIYGKYRLKFQKDGYDFHEMGNLELVGHEDRFVNEVVTHRHIEKDDNDGGSGGNTSTVHSGSNGNSFGGGGRNF